MSYQIALQKIEQALACKLISLSLSSLKLTSLPSEIGQLKSLECLDMANNQLTSLPPEMGQLGGFEKLYLYNNPLVSLPRRWVN
jgi:Leucine-rich repeat (LRR) protein